MAEVKDFISDGLTNDEIIKNVSMIIKDNKTDEYKNMDGNEKYEKLKLKYDFFANRYPMLFELALKDEIFPWDNLNYMLSMRNKIINNELTSEGASKIVGEKWFDKYVDTSTMTKQKKQKH